ncbi:MAG: flagellar basal body P-ring formation chaperone FlgA [Pseudomonadota bacterium]
MRQQATRWLSAQVAQTYPEAEVSVEIGPVDARLRLEACSGFRFFLPGTARLWGGGSVGVKCTGPAGWNLYLSYQVRLRGPALVTQGPLPARHLLADEDLVLAQVRYDQDPGSYLQSLPAGATTLRPLPAGQALLIHDLGLPNVVEAGALVRVRVNGNGFSIAQEGKALNGAKAGASVRVKMPSGRIIRGLATAGGEVEIRP